MSGPQSCYICMTKFGLFKKQYGCKGCQRTTCKDCQLYKADLPGMGIQQVCKNCHDARKQKTNNSGRVSPPANFKREMEKKEVIKKESEIAERDSTDQDIENRLKNLKESYDRKDISVEEIEKRLQNLCAVNSNVTLEELEYRLAKLKGDRPPAIRVHSIRKRGLPPNQPHSSKNESDVKQVKKLIRQYTAEIELEEGFEKNDQNDENSRPATIPENPSSDDLIQLVKLELERENDEEEAGKLDDAEILKRLSQIENAPTSPMNWKNSNEETNDEDMDEESSKLIQKLLEEDRLEQSRINSGGKSSQKQEPILRPEVPENKPDFEQDPDELPWCYLCNGDAQVRCLTCEGDLFCNKCFKYAHKDSDMKGHQTTKYTKKSGQYDDY